MAEYQVIARKWRPMRFSDVVGQEHLTRTLRNAIVQNRTAHAYLLVGSRGIGKTTTARILAKALNCLHPEDGEPCCKCESCLAVANNSSLDIVEIDAASQNSVNDIRALREQAQFAPVHSRYKIYIVDEVHMLSASAWNAFLKILEEPPPHVKFIFATTEVHRVLPTIISRCQRFDLRRIPTHLIVQRLAHIVEVEKIPVSTAALEAIARSADGGMRDAQSLLDQVITFFSGSDAPIDEKQIFSLFGLTSPEEMDALLTAILTDNRPGVIHALYALSSQGRNLETLLEELIEQLRGILLANTVPDAATILETSQEQVNHLLTLGRGIIPSRIQSLLEALTPMGYGLRNALNKQVFLETALLKAMREAFTVRIDDLLAQIQKVRETGDLAPLEELKISPFSFPTTSPNISKTEKKTTNSDVITVEEVVEAPQMVTPAVVETETIEPVVEVVSQEEPSVDIHEIVIESADVPENEAVETITEHEDMVEDETETVHQNIENSTEIVVENSSVLESAPIVEMPEDMPPFDIDDTPSSIPNFEPVESPIREDNPLLNQWPFVEDKKEDSAVTVDPSAEIVDELLEDKVPVLEDPVIVVQEEAVSMDEVAEIEEETEAMVEPLVEAESIENEPVVDSFEETQVVFDDEPIMTAQDVPVSAQEPWTPRSLWDALRADVREHIQNPTLNSVMTDATPNEIRAHNLLISFDEEFENQHAEIVIKMNQTLNNCLKRITDGEITQLMIQFKKGIAPIIQKQKLTASNIDQEILRVSERPYVQKAMDLFGGEIVDIH